MLIFQLVFPTFLPDKVVGQEEEEEKGDDRQYTRGVSQLEEMRTFIG